MPKINLYKLGLSLAFVVGIAVFEIGLTNVVKTFIEPGDSLLLAVMAAHAVLMAIVTLMLLLQCILRGFGLEIQRQILNWWDWLRE
jgi:hypothetical protein